MVVLLIVAGHETTVSLIANAVLALLTNPEQFASCRADAALMPAAVEELLRYDSPVERTITALGRRRTSSSAVRRSAEGSSSSPSSALQTATMAGSTIRRGST